MATATQEAPEGERLARIETSLEFLMREASQSREDMREMRKDMRVYFPWLLGIMLGLIAPSLLGLLAAVILKG